MKNNRNFFSFLRWLFALYILVIANFLGCAHSPKPLIDCYQKPGIDPRRYERVAVLDFRSPSFASPAGVEASNIVGLELMKKGYLVVERSRVDQVLKEQSLGLTGAIDESTAGKIGKILGVQALIIGTVGNYKATTRTKITPTKHGPKGGMEFESTASITIKMVDVVDSGIVWAGEGNCIASGSNPAVPLEATIKALIKKFPRR